MTHEQIASTLGAHRTTVTRALARRSQERELGGTERAGPRPRCGCTGIWLGVVGSNGCAARMGGSVGGGIARRTSRIPRGYSLR